MWRYLPDTFRSHNRCGNYSNIIVKLGPSHVRTYNQNTWLIYFNNPVMSIVSSHYWHKNCLFFKQNTCIITWTATTTTGLYAVSLQIEDYMRSSGAGPLSSIPLQFLINVFSSSRLCGTPDRPFLVAGETPADDSCIPVPFGTTYTAGIVASSNSSLHRLVSGFENIWLWWTL